MKNGKSRYYYVAAGELMEKMENRDRRENAENGGHKEFRGYRDVMESMDVRVSVGQLARKAYKANRVNEVRLGREVLKEKTGVMAATESMHALSRSLKSLKKTFGCSGKMASKKTLGE